MSTIRTSASIATAAALFAISTMAGAADPPRGSNGRAVAATDVVHCYGVNTCRGSADCGTTEHSCRGMNDCRGKGFKAMAASACLAASGVIGDLR